MKTWKGAAYRTIEEEVEITVTAKTEESAQKRMEAIAKRGGYDCDWTQAGKPKSYVDEASIREVKIRDVT